MAFIRRKRKELENQQESEKVKREKSAKEAKLREKHLKICRNSLVQLSLIRWAWLSLLCMFGFGLYVGHEKEFFNYQEVEGQWISSFILVIIFSLICVIKLFSSLGLKKRVGSDSRRQLKEFPDRPNTVVRELYTIVAERKCLNFWIIFTLVILAFLNVLYVLVASGICKGIGWNEPYLYQKAHWSNPINWLNEFKKWTDTTQVYTTIKLLDWSQLCLLISGIMGLFLAVVYASSNIKNNRVLKAIESVYGKERLMDECQYVHRMHKANRRYKTLSFVILCVIGVGFYFFFKKIICMIFDKSFSF